jgi:hypothetical protein
MGTLVSVASLLAARLYQGNPDRNQKIWNIVSTERDILHIYRCCWSGATYKWKVSFLRSRYEADLSASVVSFISTIFKFQMDIIY